MMRDIDNTELHQKVDEVEDVYVVNVDDINIYKLARWHIKSALPILLEIDISNLDSDKAIVPNSL